MKILVTLFVLFGAAFASADYEDQQKQNQAEKLFKVSSVEQAIKNPKFVKKWQSIRFEDVKRWSSSHDDCIAGDTYNGNYASVCLEKGEVYVDVDGDGDGDEWQTQCIKNGFAQLLKPASQAPSAVTVDFYRKVPGLSDYEQTSSKYRVGKAKVTVPACN